MRNKFVAEESMDIYSEAKEFLKRLIKIDTVEGAAEINAPFGAGNRKCLDLVLKKMREEGFCIKDGEGYYGYGEIGEGELFGVLNHLDVVPVGANWTHNPFGAEETDGKIFGRGALDDKGPFAAAFFAAVKLLREGEKPKKRLRFIVGCDEESGWKCMDRYVENEEMPKAGFSPDGDFPVINCEKGIVYHILKCPLPKGIISVTAGERANMVPNFARAELADDGFNAKYLEAIGAEFTAENGKIILETVGKAAHGSHPEAGDNALIKLLKILAPMDENIDEVYRAFCLSDGSGIGLKISDEKSGALTLNLGCARTEGDKIIFELDVRHPVSFNKDEVTAAIKKTLKIEVEQGFYHLPLFVDKDNELVQTLLNAYNTVTGENARPLAIGGGTYARVLPLGVAFGPCFPNGNSGMHCADEYMDLNDFKKMIDIYYLAIKKLCF